LVTNRLDCRRVRWIPPNGRIMDSNETILVPGVLETLLSAGLDPSLFDLYEREEADGDVSIRKVGYYTAGGDYHVETIGDGYSTIFDVDAGFDTSSSTVFLYDLSRETMVQFFGVERGVPGANWVRITLDPAPAPGEIEVYVFE